VNRRKLITLLGGAAAAWPLAAGAQQAAEKLPRIGSIQNFRNENFEAFIQGLREAGYVDGQNMLLETRFYAGVLDRIDEFTSELVALKCSVILATAPYAVQAVMKATSKIPIVGIDLESDPVANGWVRSLARPGGNFTGLFLDIPSWGANRSNSSRKPCRRLRVWQFSGMRRSAQFNLARRRRRHALRESRLSHSRSGMWKTSRMPSSAPRVSESMGWSSSLRR